MRDLTTLNRTNEVGGADHTVSGRYAPANSVDGVVCATVLHAGVAAALNDRFVRRETSDASRCRFPRNCRHFIPISGRTLRLSSHKLHRAHGESDMLSCRASLQPSNSADIETKSMLRCSILAIFGLLLSLSAQTTIEPADSSHSALAAQKRDRRRCSVLQRTT